MNKKLLTALLFSCFFISILSAGTTDDTKCLTCNPPENIKIIPTVDGTSAYFSWSRADSSQYYHIQYKLETDTVWSEGILEEDIAYYYPTLQVRQYNLKPCSKYRMRISARCRNQNVYGDWKVSDIFSTLGCAGVDYGCAKPRTIVAKSYRDDSIEKISWAIDTNLNTATYFLHITADDGSYNKTFSEQLGNNFEHDFYTTLSICKKYTAALKLRCGVSFSDSVVLKFQTTGCSLINGVCSPPTIVKIGGNYNDSLKVYWNGTASKYYVEYRDSTSQVFWTRDSTTTTLAYLTHLKQCSNYEVRVRAVCNGMVSAPSPATQFRTYSDDCFSFVDNCFYPNSYFYNSKQDTIYHSPYSSIVCADFSGIFFTPTYFSKVIVQYRRVWDTIDGDWIRDTINNSNYTTKFKNLEPCKVYEFGVSTLCYNNIHSPARGGYMKVSCFPACNPIANLTGTNTGDDTQLSWTVANAAHLPVGYQIQYRALTDTAWSEIISTSTPTLLLKNLAHCTRYVARVRAICDVVNTFNDSGNWQEIIFKSGENCLRGENSGLVNKALTAVSVSSNPGSENPTVIFKLEQQTAVQFDIFNINGSLVGAWNAGVLSSGNYTHTFDQLENNLSSGFYIIVFKTDNCIEKILKWVKN